MKGICTLVDRKMVKNNKSAKATIQHRIFGSSYYIMTDQPGSRFLLGSYRELSNHTQNQQRSVCRGCPRWLGHVPI